MQCKTCNKEVASPVARDYCSKKCYSRGYYLEHKDYFARYCAEHREKRKNYNKLDRARNWELYDRYSKEYNATVYNGIVEHYGAVCIDCGLMHRGALYIMNPSKVSLVSCSKGNWADSIYLLCANCAMRRNASEPKTATPKRMKRLRTQIIEAHGGKCVHCGDTDREVLQIHHPNRDGQAHRKSCNGDTGRYLSELLANPDRCEVLCANCHLIETRKRE